MPGRACILLELPGPRRTHDCRRDIIETQDPGERELRHGEPGSGGDGLNSMHGFQGTPFKPGLPEKCPHLAACRPRSSGRSLAKLILAGERALGKRRPDDLRNPFVFAKRNNLRLGFPPKKGILGLA